MLYAFVEGLDMVEAGLEEVAIGGITIGGDALEEDGIAVLETVSNHCQSIFQVHRNYKYSSIGDRRG